MNQYLYLYWLPGCLGYVLRPQEDFVPIQWYFKRHYVKFNLIGLKVLRRGGGGGGRVQNISLCGMAWDIYTKFKSDISTSATCTENKESWQMHKMNFLPYLLHTINQHILFSIFNNTFTIWQIGSAFSRIGDYIIYYQ